ncbi:MAG: hypothetical protein ACRDQ4_16500 [Pseudonocardiaceae bacterium]
MSTARDTPRGIDPVASTPVVLGMEAALDLSARTRTWLAEHPHARQCARSVWDKLTELEGAGCRPETITTLRRVLAEHRPTPAGQCYACPRYRWRRRPFPCIVWHQIADQLPGVVPRRPPPLHLPTRHL